MTTYTFTNIASSAFTVDVPASNTYVQPNKGTTGTTTAGVDGSDLFTVNDADGEGSSTLLANGSRLYSRYRLTHFTSEYTASVCIPHSTFYRRGYNTTGYDARNNSQCGSTSDSQEITVPGNAGLWTINACFFAGLTNQVPDRFTFSVTDNADSQGENDLGAGAWANHNFIITGNNETLTFDGSLFSVIGGSGSNFDHEQWAISGDDKLSSATRNTMNTIITDGNTFRLRIKSKT